MLCEYAEGGFSVNHSALRGLHGGKIVRIQGREKDKREVLDF